MTVLKRLAHFLFLRLPDNVHLYQFCQRYVDRYKGENDSNIYTNGELRFMRQVLVNCQTVFDVGAHVGEWAALALGINPTITLHCFEPSQATYQMLLARLFSGGANAVSERANVICNHLGLGAAYDDKTLHVFYDGSPLNSLYQRQGLEEGLKLAPQQYTETVHIDTLDHYCQRHNIEEIDLLKVDVEGYELEVFRGATGLLAQARIKTIQFEYGGCNIDARVLLRDLFEFFHPFAYSFYKIHSKGLQRMERYDQRLENFQYQNWVVTKAD